MCYLCPARGQSSTYVLPQVNLLLMSYQKSICYLCPARGQSATYDLSEVNLQYMSCYRSICYICPARGQSASYMVNDSNYLYVIQFCLYIFYFNVAFVQPTNIFVLVNVSFAHYQNVKYVLMHT